ncbi:hypothetical protein [Nocardiopsis ganjiahuensis]|uniref:hypothetical protein n=1 Tax=Nocardiopsis ganjiahuensis TaxID=239984 RepID=UPI000344DAE0|nr:hypothetical protein [Nocardiopsis ganjiahuensis]
MNLTNKAWAKLSTFTLPVSKKDGDRGAGFVEYGAILVFVGLVAALLMGSGIADTIVQAISRTIRTTLNPP